MERTGSEPQSSQRPAARLQFSLRSLLVWVTAVSLFLAMYAWQGKDGLFWASLFVPSLVALLLDLGPFRRRIGFAVVTTLLTLGVTWTVLFPKNRDIFRPDTFASGLMSLALLGAAAGLLALRRQSITLRILVVALIWSLLFNALLIHQWIYLMPEIDRISRQLAQQDLRLQQAHQAPQAATESASKASEAETKPEACPAEKPETETSPSTVTRLSPELLGTCFDELWEDMDYHYSYFELKKIDWPALRERYRPQAVQAASRDEFIGVLKAMLTELRDLHVWIETEAGMQGTYSSPWRRNWNTEVVLASLEKVEACGKFAWVGTTKPDGFGCVVLNQQGSATPEDVAQTVAAIQRLHEVPGFLVDLRGGASGGNEGLAQTLAAAFCSEATVYGQHQVRCGPDHDELTEVQPRMLEPGSEPFTKPVVCLIGQRCMSSGEALVMMLDCLPQVTTIGQRTRGASGNPQKFPLPELDLAVWYSRWVDLLPDGTPLEGRGIVPDVEDDEPVDAYRRSDPTWERALVLLREKVAAVNPAPTGQP